MSIFVPEKEHLLHTLLFLFNPNKKAVENHILLVESYGEHSPSIRTCDTWFRQFKDGNFNVKNKTAKMRNGKHYWMMTQLKQRYRQQMINLNHALIEKRPEWAKRHGEVILLYNYARLTCQNWQKTP